MKDMLIAIVDRYRDLWLKQVELLKEYPNNEFMEYHRKLYFARYVIAEQAEIDYCENGIEVDLNDLARRLDGVRVALHSWAQEK